MTTGRGQTTCLTQGNLRGSTSRWGGASAHLDTMEILAQVPDIFTNPIRPTALPGQGHGERPKGRALSPFNRRGNRSGEVSDYPRAPR